MTIVKISLYCFLNVLYLFTLLCYHTTNDMLLLSKKNGYYCYYYYYYYYYYCQYCNCTYVNSPALSRYHPHFRQLTRNENVGRFYPHSFLVTLFKTLNHCVESIKVYFLNKSTNTLLKFENNLAINVRYKH